MDSLRPTRWRWTQLCLCLTQPGRFCTPLPALSPSREEFLSLCSPASRSSSILRTVVQSVSRSWESQGSFLLSASVQPRNTESLQTLPLGCLSKGELADSGDPEPLCHPLSPQPTTPLGQAFPQCRFTELAILVSLSACQQWLAFLKAHMCGSGFPFQVISVYPCQPAKVSSHLLDFQELMQLH